VRSAELRFVGLLWVGKEESAGLSAGLGGGDWTGRGISLRMEMSRYYKNGGNIFRKG
jgi:hypothetical protein